MCDRCSALGLTREHFDSPPFEPEGKYHQVIANGTIGQLRLRESECGLCRLLLKALCLELGDRPEVLANWDQEWEAEWYQNTAEYDPAAEGVEDQYGSGLLPRLKGGSTSNYGLQLVDESNTQRLLRARQIASRVDIERAKSWLAKCSREHGVQCLPTYLKIPEHPSRLPGFSVIDVQQQCLTPLPTGTPYTTLSYVWGKTSHPTTAKANLTTFQLPGAFERVRLPRTIRHAMEVTVALGFQFLWVDALCIVQDDDSLKRHLINNMDAVYGNSVLVIVAASGGHANAGLQGWNQDEPDEVRGSKVNLEQGLTLGVIPFFDLEMMNCILASRGWTYQETTLSPRKLVFLNGRIYFVCRSAVWREDIMAETDLVRPFDGSNTLGSTTSEWPLGCYSDHVQAYSSRKLTYHSDALNAFTGIQKALRGFMGGTTFWYGLPAAAFDWALLWDQPIGQRLTRREGFPSWTWAGWTGAVVLPSAKASADEQDWLRRRTWIDWHIINEEGNHVPIWKSPSVGDPTPREVSETSRSGSEDEFSVDVDEEFMPTYEPSRFEDFIKPPSKPLAEVAFDSTKVRLTTSPRPPELEIAISNIKGMQTNSWFGRGYEQQEDEQSTRRNRNPTCTGALIFKTPVYLVGLDFHISSPPSTRTKHKIGYPVRSEPSGKVCGLVWAPEAPNEPEKQASASLGLVLLSFAPPDTVHRDELLAAGMDNEYLPAAAQEDSDDSEERYGEGYEWDFLNVMLVQGMNLALDLRFTGDLEIARSRGPERNWIVERRGLGLMHRAALMDLHRSEGDNWTYVTLK
ncbi:hypothetical protein S40285_08718 [Stachybotrys chlorohalonatus IBT 40285]|uniref:Heterokaryon incompatibility domain-containing protein n=1 Tax=Stachybotrys chlorohalonatus (strain IBT 40285) TaxID=1283841 RepID=A0A084R0I4_STAC4|nr:hypothetical protein S40285_08718 [Stachybotrys chlorohalonata IBT 40285]